MKGAAVRNARGKKPQERFLGLPGSWTWPGWRAIGKNLWDTDDDAVFMPPKVWGFGWSLNFAYPLIPTRPLWRRVLAFLLCLALLLLLVWALVSIGLIIYYLLTPDPNVIYVSLE